MQIEKPTFVGFQNGRDDAGVVGEISSRTNQVCSQQAFSASVKSCVRAHDVIVASNKKTDFRRLLKWSG